MLAARGYPTPAMEDLLGIIGIIIFCACVISLAAAITWLVVKLSPSKSAKKAEPTPEAPA